MKLNMTYRRTAAGDAALRSSDTAIPVDYRRILCVIGDETHANVVRGRLRQFSDALISDWLAELEEIGFIEPTGGGGTASSQFQPLANEAQAVASLSSVPEEQRRLDSEVGVAKDSLKDKGAYLSTDRLANREPLAKTPAETVILLVEDDPDQAALADLRVSMAGYRVRVARNIQEMVADLSNESLADLVLLDAVLPDGHGFGILACMRMDPRLSLLPVIMLTALTSAGDIRRGLDLGADGYITKPYSKDLLVRTIREVLRQA